MVQAMAGGVNAPPIPTPMMNELFPRARSSGAIHRPIILFAFCARALDKNLTSRPVER